MSEVARTVGRVTWPGVPRVVAVLFADGRIGVEGPSPEVEEMYRQVLSREFAATPSGPEVGRPGVLFLENLARRVGGRLELGGSDPPEPGAIY